MRLLRMLGRLPLMACAVLLIVLCLLMAWVEFGSAGEISPDETALSPAMLGKKIVIDAGHGGFDPGAIGVAGTKEKDVNLAVALRLCDYLRQAGAEVFPTRVTDAALAETKKADMAARVALAEDAEAELFVSVQANSIVGDKWRGAQVFYYRGADEGKGLAESIQAAIKEQLQNTDRTALPIDNIYVIDKLAIPSIVVEVGFLSNPEEEKLLNDMEYQNRLAYAIYCGIVSYYADVP